MKTATQFAESCIPDTSVALMPGESSETVADALLEQFWTDGDPLREDCRSALLERLGGNMGRYILLGSPHRRYPIDTYEEQQAAFLAMRVDGEETCPIWRDGVLQPGMFGRAR